jgi:hypothetical protein
MWNTSHLALQKKQMRPLIKLEIYWRRKTNKIAIINADRHCQTTELCDHLREFDLKLRPRRFPRGREDSY